MEPKIGDIIKLEIVEAKDEWNPCKDCVFYLYACNVVNYVLGKCSANSREDKKDVIFKKI